MKRFKTTRTVNLADCDVAQIVHYPKFYDWFDRNTEMMFRAAGFAWHRMLSAGSEDGAFKGMPLVDTSARFLFPCRFGDEVRVESWIGEWTGRTVVVLHEVYNRDRLAVEGREVRVWAVRDNSREAGIRAAPIPEEVIARFKD